MTFAAVPFVFSPNTLAQSAQVNADFASVVASGNNIDASQITTGVLPVTNGGTGVTTPGDITTSIGAVAKTGDTMTGILSVPSIRYPGTPGGNAFSWGWDGHVQAYVDGAHDGTVPSVLPVPVAEGGTGVTTGSPGPYVPTAGGTITGNLTVNGGLAAGNLHSIGSAQIDATLGVTGNINSNGNIVANGTISTPCLAGGTGQAGTLQMYNTANRINFRFDGGAQQVAYRVDNSLDRYIATTTNVFDTQFAGGGGGPTGVVFGGHDVPGTWYYCYVDYTSDERIKANIVPSAVDALTVLRQIPVDQFDIKAAVAAWFASVGKPTEERAQMMANAQPAHVPIGFIAQKLKPLIPDAVYIGPQSNDVPGSPLPRDTLTINAQALVPYLVRAIQQLAARLEALEASRGTS